MRIALVHSFYVSDFPSGENVAVDLQVEALESAGHEVRVIRQDTDTRRIRRTYPAEAALTVTTGIGPDPSRELDAFRPDVVHVHNLFPNFGTTWLARRDEAVVATLHNFRPMCVASTLHRDGALCTRCPDGDRWAGLRHRCYRGSVIATLPLAWRNRRGAPHDAVVARAEQLITISGRASDAFIDAGVDPAKLTVVPNFVTVDSGSTVTEPNDAWLYAGRLTEEKGIVELLREWPDDQRLDVFGDGDVRAHVEELAGPSVRLHGAVPNADLRRRLPAYRGLVFPSRWFEAGPPIIYLEALAAGVPAVAIAGNGAADDVAMHGLGDVYPRDAGSDVIRSALAAVLEGGDILRNRCRESFAARFSRARWIADIEAVYEAALAARVRR